MNGEIVLRVRAESSGRRRDQCSAFPSAPEHRAEEAFQAVCVRRRTKSSAFVDGRSGNARNRPRIDGDKRCRAREKYVDDVVIFFRFARARRVDQASTRVDAVGRMPKHVTLGRGQRWKVALMTPPANIRITTQRAETGTRRIDEHAVELSGKGQ